MGTFFFMTFLMEGLVLNPIRHPADPNSISRWFKIINKINALEWVDKLILNAC